MNLNSARFSILTLMAILCSVCLLTGFGNITNEKNYECAGKNDNGLVISREFPSLHFSGHQLKLSGSDIFSTYNFEICDENDSSVTFATQKEECRSGTSGINSLKFAYGSLSKASGRLELSGSQGLRGEYQCKEVHKK